MRIRTRLDQLFLHQGSSMGQGENKLGENQSHRTISTIGGHLDIKAIENTLMSDKGTNIIR